MLDPRGQLGQQWPIHILRYPCHLVIAACKPLAYRAISPEMLAEPLDLHNGLLPFIDYLCGCAPCLPLDSFQDAWYQGFGGHKWVHMIQRLQTHARAIGD